MSSTSPRLAVLKQLLVLLALTGFVLAPMDASAKRRKKKAKAKPAATAPVAQEGTLAIFSLTNGATVEVDGKPVGALPLPGPLKLAPGEHSIRVTLRGFTDYVDTFTITAGEETELEIDLIPVAGIVKISTPNPGATVMVNGKVVGVTPFDQEVTAGKVTLTVTQPGFEDHTQELDIRPGETYPLEISLTPLPEDQRPSTGPEFYETWWFWTVIGVAVAGGAAATAIVLTQDTGATQTPADFTISVP